MDVANLFMALTISKSDSRYALHLVNDSTDQFERVVAYTGAHDGSGEELIETSRVRKEVGALAPRSAVLLEASDLDSLDFSIWYQLDLYGWQGFGPYQLFASIPKYAWDYEKKQLISLFSMQRG